MIEEITISLRRYNQLLEDSKLLAHLEANGVDNWEGYSCPDEEEENDC
jgi:hypothetical protein